MWLYHGYMDICESMYEELCSNVSVLPNQKTGSMTSDKVVNHWVENRVSWEWGLEGGVPGLPWEKWTLFRANQNLGMVRARDWDSVSYCIHGGISEHCFTNLQIDLCTTLLSRAWFCIALYSTWLLDVHLCLFNALLGPPTLHQRWVCDAQWSSVDICWIA